jgi:hypothetical protein
MRGFALPAEHLGDDAPDSLDVPSGPRLASSPFGLLKGLTEPPLRARSGGKRGGLRHEDCDLPVRCRRHRSRASLVNRAVTCGALHWRESLDVPPPPTFLVSAAETVALQQSESHCFGEVVVSARRVQGMNIGRLGLDRHRSLRSSASGSVSTTSRLPAVINGLALV